MALTRVSALRGAPASLKISTSLAAEACQSLMWSLRSVRWTTPASVLCSSRIARFRSNEDHSAEPVGVWVSASVVGALGRAAGLSGPALRRGSSSASGASSPAAASTAVPAFADSISDIAARNAKAAEEAAAAAAAKEAAGPEEKGNPALLVGGIVVGGTVASTAFYTKNLERLGKKIVTGKNQR